MLRALFRFNRAGLKPSPAMIRRELCNDLTEHVAELVASRNEAEMPGLYQLDLEAAKHEIIRERTSPLRVHRV